VEAIAARGRFNLALSGGFTPLDTYRMLPETAAHAGLNWLHVYVFWSDERCVPTSDPANNYRMAHTNFLADVPIPNENIHPIECEGDPEREAARYEDLLRTHFRSEDTPQFDLVLLGLGRDGHVASLFPKTEALTEDERLVVASFAPDRGQWRMSFTPKLINAAKGVVFLVRSKAKSEAVRQAFSQEVDPLKWPVRLVDPVEGTVHWFMDEAAATLIGDEVSVHWAARDE
jgi:6-phosphogluconolactonase